MLPKINALPGPKGTLAIPDRYVQIRLRQDAAYVRRHVVRAFRSMREHRISVGDMSRHKRLEVGHDTRISVLTEHQRRACMPNKDMAKAGLDTRIAHGALHIAAQLIGSATLGRDLDLVLRNQGT